MEGKKTDGKKSVEEIIDLTVAKAIAAQQLHGEHSAKDASKATERRLYALPDLRRKLADDKERMEEIKQYGPRERSKSITRFVKSGTRLTKEELFETQMLDLEASIAESEHEIEEMERAMEIISDDEYYAAVYDRFINRMQDEEIAETLLCDVSTVWRNRKRLISRLSVLLYGVDAIK